MSAAPARNMNLRLLSLSLNNCKSHSFSWEMLILNLVAAKILTQRSSAALQLWLALVGMKLEIENKDDNLKKTDICEHVSN